jgi:hypothetical protein
MNMYADAFTWACEVSMLTLVVAVMFSMAFICYLKHEQRHQKAKK